MEEEFESSDEEMSYDAEMVSSTERTAIALVCVALMVVGHSFMRYRLRLMDATLFVGSLNVLIPPLFSSIRRTISNAIEYVGGLPGMSCVGKLGDTIPMYCRRQRCL